MQRHFPNACDERSNAADAPVNAIPTPASYARPACQPCRLGQLLLQEPESYAAAVDSAAGVGKSGVKWGAAVQYRSERICVG